MSYSFAQLKDLWIQAGGNPVAATMAAAIALAESGGNPQSTNSNSNGTIDRGLWQINSIHGSQSTFDPLANARAAVQISNNGTTWRPWCTAWSNGRCGGTFMGPGSPVLKFLNGASANDAVNTATGSSSASNADFQPTGLTDLVDPRAWAKAFLEPIGTWLWYGVMGLIGAWLITQGLILIVVTFALKSAVGKRVSGAVQNVAVGRLMRVGSGKTVVVTQPSVKPVQQKPARETPVRVKSSVGEPQRAIEGEIVE